jgi:rhodanese-related sulfurtransferase
VKSATDLVDDAKARIRQVTPGETMGMRDETPSLVVLDCREPNEWNLGRIPGSLFIPRGILESSIEAAVPRDRALVIYCASGNRSALAADVLQQMGYTNVTSMSGGFRGWVDAGGEVED